MADNRLEPVDYSQVRSLADGLCHICLFPMDGDRGHVDHVVPIARGGAHAMDNLALAHSRCNGRKSDTLISELDLEAIRAGAWQEPFALAV